jgi:hypothetical protein
MKIATIKNVQQLFDFEISSSTASRYINQCRDAVGKTKNQILTVSEFCKYHSIPQS